MSKRNRNRPPARRPRPRPSSRSAVRDAASTAEPTVPSEQSSDPGEPAVPAAPGNGEPTVPADQGSDVGEPAVPSEPGDGGPTVPSDQDPGDLDGPADHGSGDPTEPADGVEGGDGPAAARPRVRRRARRAGADTSPHLRAAKRSVWSRLYHGETNIVFVGRRRVWFGLSLALVAISLVSFATRGLNLGIDFEGGVVWEVPAGDASVADARDAVDQFGLGGATIQELESDEGREIRVESEVLSAKDADAVKASLAELTGAASDDVNFTQVGATWGDEISEKAIRALIVFMVLVTLYISLRFELKMAVATLAALVHDVIITVGVYSVTQLEVTPATVIAVLTILGYSIYDGIVVFDKVDENTRLVSSTGGLSYAGMIDVSLNQALMRSLNTTITALLPVGSLLVVGSWLMGASVLEEFALALLIGLFSGAYSSIFIASPLLAVLKEREPRYRDIKRRIAERGGDRAVVEATVATGRPPSTRAVAAAATRSPARPGDGGGSAPSPTVAPSGRVIPPRPRKKTRRR